MKTGMENYMERITLNQTDLKVSKLALGTADYGTKYDETTAFLQMDTFTEGGGNFIDTANVYGSWVPGMGNISERVIGSWMKQKKNRNEIVISTKGAHPPLENMNLGRVHPEDIEKDLDDSLAGLLTDHIDLYFLHRDDPQLPVEEILGCLEEQVKKGKIRYYGCSNWRLPRIREAQKAAQAEGFRGFVCNQVMYSLATVDEKNLWDPTLVAMDRETYENHRKAGWNVMAYMALARGYLVKKVRGMELHQATAPAYTTAANERLAAYLGELEKDGYAPEEVSLAYLMQQELRTVPIVSFSRIDQLQSALRSCERKLPGEIMEKLEALRKQE